MSRAPFDWPLSKDVLTDRSILIESVYRILLIVRKVDSSLLSDQGSLPTLPLLAGYCGGLMRGINGGRDQQKDHDAIVDGKKCCFVCAHIGHVGFAIIIIRLLN